jgi:hypothetical protein
VLSKEQYPLSNFLRNSYLSDSFGGWNFMISGCLAKRLNLGLMVSQRAKIIRVDQFFVAVDFIVYNELTAIETRYKLCNP